MMMMMMMMVRLSSSSFTSSRPKEKSHFWRQRLYYSYFGPAVSRWWVASLSFSISKRSGGREREREKMSHQLRSPKGRHRVSDGALERRQPIDTKQRARFYPSSSWSRNRRRRRKKEKQRARALGRTTAKEDRSTTTTEVLCAFGDTRENALRRRDDVGGGGSKKARDEMIETHPRWRLIWSFGVLFFSLFFSAFGRRRRKRPSILTTRLTF